MTNFLHKFLPKVGKFKFPKKSSEFFGYILSIHNLLICSSRQVEKRRRESRGDGSTKERNNIYVSNRILSGRNQASLEPASTKDSGNW